MKLENQRAGRGRARSAEVIRPAEAMPDRIFDPRLDLQPGEYNALRETIKREGEGRVFREPVFRLHHLSWMSWFDPSFHEDLRQKDKYQKFRLQRALDSVEMLQVKDPLSLVEPYKEYLDIAHFLQEFPEARPQLLSEKFLDDFLKANIEDSESIISYYLVSFLQIWPDQRNKILSWLFPDGVDKYMSDTTINGMDDPFTCCHYVAQLIVVFPERRDQLMKLVEPRLPEIRTELRRMSQDGSSEGFQHYHQLIGDLTILGAQQAHVDHRGLIQVQLRPLHAPSPAPQLPERSRV